MMVISIPLVSGTALVIQKEAVKLIQNVQNLRKAPKKYSESVVSIPGKI